MNYPFDLQRREATAVARRRVRAQNGRAAADRAPITDHLPADTVALALSGGGIRCATFSLGILQALAKKGRLRRIDILSSCSGGGFAASFLGRLYTREVVAGQEDPCERVEEIMRDGGSPQLSWVREHANYLLSDGGSDVRQTLALLWRNYLTTYFVFTCLGLFVFGLLRLISETVLVKIIPEPPLPSFVGADALAIFSPWWWLPPALLCVCVVPAALGFWLAPKVGSRSHFSFFPVTGWVVMLAGLAAGAGVVGGLMLPGIVAAVLLLLAAAWLEAARLCLPGSLDATTSGESSPDAGTVIRNRLNRALGEVLTLFLASLAWVLIDSFGRGLGEGVRVLVKAITAWGVVLAPIIPFLNMAAKNLGQRAADSDSDSAFSSIIPPASVRAALIAFPLAGFLLVVLDGLAHWCFDQGLTAGVYTVLLAGGLSLIFGRGFDFLNFSALQEAYAVRLSRTFLGASNPARYRAAADEAGNDVSLAHPDDDMDFDEYHPEGNGGPLHLIGLCVNETIDAASARDIRDRKGLSMCVSPCGVSVGRPFHAVWAPQPNLLPWRVSIQRWLDGRLAAAPGSRTALRAIPSGDEIFHVLKGKHERAVPAEALRLSNWIATSGAAFGTGTGRTTSLPISLLLGLGNVRLGYWWDSSLGLHDRPGVYRSSLWRRLKELPALLFPMQTLLISEFLGSFGGPSRRFWNLSDGGHFDVTAVYELLRRRVPFIIAVDGGADENLWFEDVGNMVREVRTDFGATVEFFDPAAGAIPLPAWIASWIDLGQIARLDQIGAEGGKHAGIARVTYKGSNAETWLVLLKASVTGDESTDIASFRRTDKAFPSDPTADQFFNEATYESYRALGEHVATKVLV